MDNLGKMLRAVHTAASTMRVKTAPSHADPVIDDPAEGLRFVRAFATIEDPALRRLICETLEALSAEAASRVQ